jgi:hypothetical protein
LLWGRPVELRQTAAMPQHNEPRVIDLPIGNPPAHLR